MTNVVRTCSGRAYAFKQGYEFPEFIEIIPRPKGLERIKQWISKKLNRKLPKEPIVHVMMGQVEAIEMDKPDSVYVMRLEKELEDDKHYA